MQVLRNIPCDAGVRRSQLKHTWLENQIINKSEDDIVYFWEAFRWPALENEFPVRIREAEKFLVSFDVGFSPAQLVDLLTPFAKVPEDVKVSVKRAVHAAYLEQSEIADHRRSLSEAVTVLSGVLDRFRKVWERPVSQEAEHEVRETWRELHHSAVRLRDELDKLPRNILLP